MAFFNNMTSDASNMMYMGKYDKNAKNGEAAFKLYNFTVNATPKNCISMSHTWTKQQEWTGDKYSQAVKNATKVGIKHADTKWDVAAANDKWSVKIGHPLYSDDWKVNGSVNVEGKPAKKETKVTAESSIVSPDFSGVKAFANVSVESTFKDINTEKDTSKNAKMVRGFAPAEIKFDANINFEKDYYVGAAVEHNTTKVTDAAFSFVKNEDSSKYWLNYNATKSEIGTGCLINYAEKNFTHVYEAKYNHDNKATLKLFAQPLSLAAGGKYVLSKDSTLLYGLEFAKEISAQAKFDHKLDKHWKVSIHQSFDAHRLADGKRAPYDLGFNVAYNL